MKLTRRQFNQIAMALGLSVTGGGLVGGCGEDELSGSGPTTGDLETKTLHFDLSRSPIEAEHTLHANAKRYRLQRHNAESRRRARESRPGLEAVEDRFLTHYADDVEVSLTRQHRMHVTLDDPVRGHGLALVGMYIPTEARRRARANRNVAQRSAAECERQRAQLGSADCNQIDQVEDDYLTGRSSAKSIITHHTDLVNLDPDAAAAVEAHMDGDQAAAVDNLTISICNQGPAYEYDPNFLDGWCVLVRMYNDDGTPLLDMNGEQIFDYQFSDQTSIDLQPAIASVLASVKNDPALEGEQYQVIYHGDPVDEDALPDATSTVLNSDDTTALVAAGGQGAGSAQGNVNFSTNGYHHNVLFYDASYSTVDRSFTLRILNLNFIWYGLYFEFLDADGNAISNPQRSSFLNDLVADGIDLETDTLKFWDVVSAPASVFGAPVPFPYQISMTLPDGASQVRLSLIGPGANGSLEYGPSIVIGAVLTAVLSFGVPMYFLSKATGETETLSLIDLFNQKGIILKTLLLYSQLFSAATGTSTNDLGIEGSVTSILATLTQDLFLNMKSTLPELWDWLVGEVAEAEAEESVPFVGWVIRILAIAGTTADMLTSEAEICTNPFQITNTVSFTNSVTVVISHDPEDFEFPLVATHYEVEIVAGDKPLEPLTVVPIADEDRSNDTLTVVVPNVPTTGAPATVTVRFLADNGYMAAQSCRVDQNGVPVLDENGNRIPDSITFTNKLPADGSPLVVNVPIVENPTPIDAQTVYMHHHKLEYAGGKYEWNYTSTPPALEPASCGTAPGLCDLGEVTVWVPGGMIGYSWLASSPGVAQCSTGATGQLYNFKNISLKNDPNQALKSPGCGFPAAVPITYDQRVPVGDNGYHFYLDPVKISDTDPESHLRRIILDNGTPISVNTNESWGRFRMGIDRIAVYSKGPVPKVVGISRRFHKFSVLEVPSTPYIGDDFANNAKIMSAQGESNDSLLLNPVALTIAEGGAILILQGGLNRSIKAFDFDGKPWKFFFNGTASVLPLDTESGEFTWLDISIDPTNLLYILSYSGSGTQVSDYRLDVYDAVAGTRIVRNTGVAVGRIVVDKFRDLYTLNYETVKGSPIIEPSVSVWAPSAPTPTPTPRS